MNRLAKLNGNRHRGILLADGKPAQTGCDAQSACLAIVQSLAAMPSVADELERMATWAAEQESPLTAGQQLTVDLVALVVDMQARCRALMAAALEQQQRAEEAG